MNRKRGSRCCGFALVLTLSLLAFLVLVVFATTVLVRVSVQVSDSQSAQLQAQQNAKVGLAVALQQLQVAAGPDNVVTGRSSVRAKSAEISSMAGWWTRNVAAPDNWLVSGNFSPGTARTIDYNTKLIDSDSVVVLVGAKSITASADYARAIKVRIPTEGTAGGGQYAFWIGDEGVKASLSISVEDAPKASTGIALIADPRGEIPNFKFGNAAVLKVVAFEQFRNVDPSDNLKARFHDYAPRSRWIVEPTLVAGLFNVNTTSVDSWAAILRTYDAARGPGTAALGDRVYMLADRVTGRYFSASGSGKIGNGGPFRSAAGFWDSNIIQAALDMVPKITDVTQLDIQSVISPLLTVRSDTFRVRAYGESTNPLDEGKIRATAYCEAMVQRTPELIDATLGRRFVITYFRWLGPDDI